MDRTDRMNRILKLLKDHPEGLTMEEFVLTLGVTRQTITMDLRELIGSDKVRKREVGSGVIYYRRKG
jgi:DNA-binding transcriptional ArsR family regulator